MRTPNSPFIEPAFQECFLILSDGLSRQGWRHDLVRVVAGDAMPQSALQCVSWCDDGASDGLVIESQVGLSVGCIGTVAMKTMFGQNGANMEPEIDARWGVG